MVWPGCSVDEGWRVMRQGPLAGRYPAVAGMVVCALVPYLALSGALGPITPLIAGRLHMSLQTMSIGSGIANAAYAAGTVLAVQFAQLLPQRRMMVLYAAVLVLASLLTAAAQDARDVSHRSGAAGVVHQPAAHLRRAAAVPRFPPRPGYDRPR